MNVRENIFQDVLDMLLIAKKCHKLKKNSLLESWM